MDCQGPWGAESDKDDSSHLRGVQHLYVSNEDLNEQEKSMAVKYNIITDQVDFMGTYVVSSNNSRINILLKHIEHSPEQNILWAQSTINTYKE